MVLSRRHRGLKSPKREKADAVEGRGTGTAGGYASRKAVFGPLRKFTAVQKVGSGSERIRRNAKLYVKASGTAGLG